MGTHERGSLHAGAGVGLPPAGRGEGAGPDLAAGRDRRGDPDGSAPECRLEPAGYGGSRRPGGDSDADGEARAERFVVCYTFDQAARDATVREYLVAHLQTLFDGSTGVDRSTIVHVVRTAKQGRAGRVGVLGAGPSRPVGRASAAERRLAARGQARRPEGRAAADHRRRGGPPSCLDADIARGTQVRHDWGSQHLLAHFAGALVCTTPAALGRCRRCHF